MAAGLSGAVAVAFSSLLLDGGSAYGSWTPRPVPLSDVAAGRAAATCSGVFGVPEQGARVALAERRGEWTYVVVAGPGREAVCLMPNDLVGRSAGERRAFFGTYHPVAVDVPVVAPGHVRVTEGMEGSTEEGWFIWFHGYVGSDVVGVTVHTSTGLDIEASVAGDRFAAWWPSVEPDSEHPSETWTYTAHLADGSTRRLG
ncbi:hypothetical protein [Nocardioides stalactiti]|uniref:hypothetical protein n=1 Tax=Nocardioides stalactiti TaxID=2755356 RepID=UPI001601324D|nr:hypothetical protein [Nocardioides stalactiti]